MEGSKKLYHSLTILDRIVRVFVMQYRNREACPVNEVKMWSVSDFSGLLLAAVVSVITLVVSWSVRGSV